VPLEVCPSQASPLEQAPAASGRLARAQTLRRG
jgi:hypothetical protein